MCFLKIFSIFCFICCYIAAAIAAFFIGGLLIKYYWLSGNTGLDNGGMQWLWDHWSELVTMDGTYVAAGFASIGIFIAAMLLFKLTLWVIWRILCGSDARLKKKKKTAKYTKLKRKPQAFDV